jgi:hypothetical protein
VNPIYILHIVKLDHAGSFKLSHHVYCEYFQTVEDAQQKIAELYAPDRQYQIETLYPKDNSPRVVIS